MKLPLVVFVFVFSICSVTVSGCAGGAQEQSPTSINGGSSMALNTQTYLLGVDLVRAMDAAGQSGGKFASTFDKKAGSAFDQQLQVMDQSINKLEKSGNKSELVMKLIGQGKDARKTYEQIKDLTKDNRVDIVQFRARSMFRSISDKRAEVTETLARLGESILPTIQTDSKMRKAAFYIRANTLLESSKQSGSLLSKLSMTSAVDQNSKKVEFEKLQKSVRANLQSLESDYAGDAELAPYLTYVKDAVTLRLTEYDSVYQMITTPQDLGPNQARILRRPSSATEKDLLEELRLQL